MPKAPPITGGTPAPLLRAAALPTAGSAEARVADAAAAPHAPDPDGDEAFEAAFAETLGVTGRVEPATLSSGGEDREGAADRSAQVKDPLPRHLSHPCAASPGTGRCELTDR